MAMLNSPAGYGGLTKAFHWLIVALFAFQYVAAAIMLNMAPNTTVLGGDGNFWFNWHKSIGLVALVIAIGRLWARQAGQLPAWAPTLQAGEKAFIHRAEQVLYAAMLVMPVSGFVYVMAAGYGVHFFEAWHLPNPIGKWPLPGEIAKWVHIVAGYVLGATILAHVGLVLWHTLFKRDGLIFRMLPGRRG